MTEDNYNRDYYQANKTYFSQYMKEYYAHNKEVYLRKVNCPTCGKKMAKTNVKRHQKSHLCVPPEEQKKFFIPDIPKNPIAKQGVEPPTCHQSGSGDSTVQETLQCVAD